MNPVVNQPDVQIMKLTARLPARDWLHRCSGRLAVPIVLALLAFATSASVTRGDEQPPADKPAAQAARAAEPAQAKLDEQAIRQKLIARTDFKFEKTPFAEVIEKVSEQHGVPIRLDDAALKRQGVTRNQLINVSLAKFTLGGALTQLLKPLKLHFQVVDGALLVTDVPEADLPKGPPARVIIRAAPAQPADPAVDAQLLQQQQQFSRQFQAIAKSELHFARKICEPTAEQFQQLRGDVEQTLKETLEQQTDRQKKMVAQRRNQPQAVQLDLNASAKLARDAVARSVKARLSAEQSDRFYEELAQRTLDRRETAAHNFVARLDEELILSAEQRSQITVALLARWDDSWCQSLQTFMYDEQSLPNLPEAQIVKFLNPAQKKIWPTIPKNQGTMVFGGGFFGAMLGEDIFGDADGDLPAAAVREE